ncbi:hypothetical protein [Caulobacter hibisci]|uniref:Uncharacterized protein n=1 Tax=Caulobacter hibisci TaxID=2035993 RepID=A0ABS0T497_9CAUL|nr:hypothetical protein [Caulobacter hibisci]MBI1685657.1 hypothetical protein [Caulobacter hibisci]
MTLEQVFEHVRAAAEGDQGFAVEAGGHSYRFVSWTWVQEVGGPESTEIIQNNVGLVVVGDTVRTVGAGQKTFNFQEDDGGAILAVGV